jgi:apolipoprotein N-acyltransferase
MRGLRVPLLFGVLTVGRGDKYPYNSAYMMEPDGRITGRFDKNYLLVFGEYIPFYEHIPSFKKWFPAASHFAHGSEVTVFPFRQYQLGPLICYEDIIPNFGRRLAPLKPNLLVNITNDAWFGATSEPAEHLALSVFRAVELRLGLIRAVNTGISAFVDATGRIYRKSPSFDPVITPGVPPLSLLDEAAMLPGGETVYAAVGDLFGYLDLTAVLVLLFLPARLLGGVSGERQVKRIKKRRK